MAARTKVHLTDKFIRSLRPPQAKPIMDQTPNLGVMVGKTGRRYFVYVGRFPGSVQPTKAPLGDYREEDEAAEDGKISLAEARAKALAYRKDVDKGVDPRPKAQRREEAGQAQADAEAEAMLFENVAVEFKRRVLVGKEEKKPLLRTGPATAREIDQIFTSRFRGRSIETITQRDIEQIIDRLVEDGKAAHAHNMFGHIRKLFNWALSRSSYNHLLLSSPCDRLKPKKLIGPKASRERTLTAGELQAFWAATETLGHPFRDMIRLLALTGLRLNEVAQASRSEIDKDAKTLNIPGARMKNKKPFIAPLAPDAMALVERLPQNSGPYLFSTTHGKRPVSGFSKIKARLDKAILEEMRKGAADPESIELEPWTFHDLRRTLRTGLSALRIPEDIRELVLAHGKSGLRKTYDQHDFLDEKREALEKWEGRLRGFINPPPPAPPNVVSFPHGAAA